MRLKKEYSKKWNYCKRCGKKFDVDGYYVKVCPICRPHKSWMYAKRGMKLDE